MIRLAPCLLLCGCVAIVPVLNEKTQTASCCEALIAVDRSTDGYIAITKPAETLQIKIGAHWKF
jgi:hypothetical protein